MSGGEPFEPLQVIGNMPRDLAVFTYDAILPDGGNDGKLHTATSNLIGS
jgi:hypothetical protein